MGLFGWGKKPIAAEMAGRNLTNLLIDADECWKDVCGLRSYKTSGPIATCEVAFARAGLVKSIIERATSPAIAKRALIAADELISEAFSAEDTEETQRFYGEKLSAAATKRVEFYKEHAFFPSQIAAMLGAKLGVPGIPSVEAAYIFENVEARARSLLKKVRLV